MQSQPIWLSYDLGLPGDYDSLYVWFDQNGAKVCGKGLAHLIYTFKDNLKEELLEELNRTIDITPKAMLYLIYFDNEEQKIKGTFMVGRRRWTPWEGCAEALAQDDC